MWNLIHLRKNLIKPGMQCVCHIYRIFIGYIHRAAEMKKRVFKSNLFIWNGRTKPSLKLAYSYEIRKHSGSWTTQHTSRIDGQHTRYKRSIIYMICGYRTCIWDIYVYEMIWQSASEGRIVKSYMNAFLFFGLEN